MRKSKFQTTVAIDGEQSAIHFYVPQGEAGEAVHQVRHFSGRLFDDGFYVQLKDALRHFALDNPSEGVRRITFVLPDQAVMTDAVKVPMMKGMGQTQKALQVTLGDLFRNDRELRVSSVPVVQNRASCTFAVSAVQKQIVSALYAACAENRMLIDTLTFASAAALTGAAQVDGRLKNASSLLLDIREESARFVFSANGRAVGFYSLPFGCGLLRSEGVVQEEDLFDHSFARWAVWSATEQARPKNPGGANALEVLSEDGLSKLSGAPERRSETRTRQIPKDREGILYENFRIFVKWTLGLLESNERLTELARPGFVYVNMPQAFWPVLEKVNREARENGIEFIALALEDEKRKNLPALELYGGAFPRQIALAGKF